MTPTPAPAGGHNWQGTLAAVGDIPTVALLALAALAIVVVAVLLIRHPGDWSAYARDLIERIVATFAQGALAAVSLDALADWTVPGGDVSVDVARAAAVGGVAAVLSALKGLTARRAGDRESASLVR